MNLYSKPERTRIKHLSTK